MTAWDTLYAALREPLPDGCYRLNSELASLRIDGDDVTAAFTAGHDAVGNVVVGADGVGSTVRSQLNIPGAAAYSGYVAFRGLEPEAGLPSHLVEQPVAPDEKNGQIRHGSYQPDHFVKLDEEKLQDRRGAHDEPEGATKVSARYTTPINAHYPIELSSTQTHWDGDVLTVHDSTRWITGERTALAAYLGLPEENVRILAPLVGGAFGSKSFLWMHVALCAVAAREVRRPVKLVLTRDQMFSSTGHRPRT